MASNTTNLNLYKKDPTTDGNDTFNIKTMLNDNWDKIDADSKVKADAIATSLDKISVLTTDLGDKTTLNTTDKTSAVKAINEVNTSLESYEANSATQINSINTALGNKLDKGGGTMAGILTAQSNTSYTVAQVHNAILSTADANIDSMNNGDLWIKYV